MSFNWVILKLFIEYLNREKADIKLNYSNAVIVSSLLIMYLAVSTLCYPFNYQLAPQLAKYYFYTEKELVVSLININSIYISTVTLALGSSLYYLYNFVRKRINIDREDDLVDLERLVYLPLGRLVYIGVYNLFGHLASFNELLFTKGKKILGGKKDE